MNTILIIDKVEGLAALPLAGHIAARSGRPLILLCVQKDSAWRLGEVREPAPGGEPADTLLAAAREAIDAVGDGPIGLYDCRGPRLHRAALDAANELGAGQLVIPVILTDSLFGGGGLATRLARSAPYDVLVLAAGGLRTPPQRVLVPRPRRRQAHAIKFSISTFGRHGDEVRILPEPALSDAAPRHFRRLRNELPADVPVSLVDTSEGGTLLDALKADLRDHDLVLFDAAEPRAIRPLIRTLQEVQESAPDMQIGVGVARAADAAGDGQLARWIEQLRRHLPTLSRDQRKNLYERLESGASLSADFIFMLTISTGIAALGLIQNSTAVVIGAMLVAPLMTPLVAVGMALAQRNLQLFRSALRTSLIGIGCALLVAALVGVLSPWGDLSAEVVARGGPNLFDLGIALLSGMAAAYALARPGLAGTLVGVAIAVALVPPLAAVGIAFTHREFGIGYGALLLFTTNFFAIVIGATMVFEFFGSAAGRVGLTPVWVRSSAVLVAIGIVAIAIPLLYNLAAQQQEGVNRAYAHPLPPALRQSIRQTAARYPGLEVVQMLHSDIEHGFGVQVILLSSSGPQPRAVNEIRRAILVAMGDDQPVNVYMVQAADTALPAP